MKREPKDYYGMYTDEGNAKVAEIVNSTTEWLVARDGLVALSEDERFGEAMDTAVREGVYAYYQTIRPVTRIDIDEALRIALIAHTSDTDKLGENYIFHPIRVAQAVLEVDEKVVALLHDVVEEHGTTRDELAVHFPDYVIDAVMALTHMPNESYTEYIDKLKKNRLAATVKRADIRDNLAPDRFNRLDEETRYRLGPKYSKALKQLNSI